MQEIFKKVHVHMPFELIPEYRKLILKEKMNLEIYFSHSALTGLDRMKSRQTADFLDDAGIKVTFHAPFMDLRPGALDEKIRQASLERLRQVFEIAPYYHPLRIVCHASFDHRYYVNCDESWLASSETSWRELIALAQETGTIIALENVYERDPYILRQLFDRLHSDYICFCFDSGHFNVFSRTGLELWFGELGPYLGHLHLHDNHGRFDEHLPIGSGNFPFGTFFQELGKISRQPLITLEAHAQDDLWQSIENIKKMEYLK
jgi:sugar phosphate isomerase/epimerase